MSAFGTTEKPVSVEWNGNNFIITVRNEIGKSYSYAHSSNGTNWSTASLPSSMDTKNPYFSKWLGTKHVMGGNLVAGSSSLLTDVTNGVVRNSVNAPLGYEVYDMEANLEYLNTITFPESTILALGEPLGNANAAYYSKDMGFSWTALGLGTIFTSFKNAAWNGRIWVGVGTGTTNTIITSVDGINWTPRGNATFSTSANAVEWNDKMNMFVAVGSGGNVIASSYDGIYWTGRSSSIFTVGNDVKCNGNVWVAAGTATGGNLSLAYSYNGVNWTAVSTFTVSGIKVYWCESKWIAIGSGTNNIAQSYNGINWSVINDTNFVGTMKNISTSKDNVYIAATNSYAILRNGSIQVKTIRNDISANTVVNFDTNVLVGAKGNIYVTSNFSNYYSTTAMSGMSSVNEFVWNNPNKGYADIKPISIACGSGVGTLAYSIDGIQWTNIPNSIFTTRSNKAVWNGKLWAAVGTGNYWVATSYDGISWTPRNNAIMTEGYDIAWNGYVFIAVGTGGNVMAKSVDGINWSVVTSTASVFSSKASAIEWTGACWLAYGSGGNTTAISSDIYGNSWNATSSKNLAITSATAATVSVASSSSNQASFEASNAFDGSFNTTMSEWYSATAKYTVTTGVYSGTTTTTYGGSNTVTGEWLQAQMTTSGVAKYYYLTINNNSTTAIPKQWTLLGSTNGTTWSLIDTFTNTVATYPNNTWRYAWTSFPINIYSNTSSYSYYRIVFQTSYGQTYVAVADLSIFYESESSTTIDTKLRPIMMKNAVLHPTQILSVDGSFLNIYQLTDLNCNLIKNLYINMNYVKNVVYGLNGGTVTSDCFDGYNHYVGGSNGNLSLVSNTSSYTNFNFDNSFNNVVLNSSLSSINSMCFNKKVVILGGTGGNVITYNALSNGIGTSTFFNTNANTIFTQVNGLASNPGYGHVYIPNTIYLKETEKLSIVSPNAYDFTNQSKASISIKQYPL